jgi:hypothetical protein
VRRRSVLAPYLWPLVWLAATAAITWSVVRFELLIVGVLTLAAALLAVAAVRGSRLHLDGRWTLPLLLVGVAVVVEVVPSFTYAGRSAHRCVLHVMALTALACALVWVAAPAHRQLVPWLAAAGYVVAAVWVIHADPAPRIDVWVILQQASDGLRHGLDAYTMTWHGSPGVTDIFSYLPLTLVLLAPGRWLAGDVRWALVAWTLVGVACVLAMGRWRSASAWAAAVLLLLVPGTTTQVEQAWTEPLLFALVAGWALLVSRDRAWWAVIPMALALASKQHIAVLLPLLAVWAPFGWRRTAATAGIAGALVAPWLLASPSALWHDTVSTLVSFHPIRFADTWYLASMHELGHQPPLWLPALVIVGVLGSAVLFVRRPGTPLDGLLRWSALVLLVVNLVNKQAFYNQFWLVGALVLLSVAVPDPGSLPGQGGEVAQPGLGERRLGDAKHRVERGAGGLVR